MLPTRSWASDLKKKWKPSSIYFSGKELFILIFDYGIYRVGQNLSIIFFKKEKKYGYCQFGTSIFVNRIILFGYMISFSFLLINYSWWLISVRLMNLWSGNKMGFRNVKFYFKNGLLYQKWPRFQVKLETQTSYTKHSTCFFFFFFLPTPTFYIV